MVLTFDSIYEFLSNPFFNNKASIISWYFSLGPDFSSSANLFSIKSFASSLNNLIRRLMSLSFARIPRLTNLVPKIRTGNSKVCLFISVLSELINTAIDWSLIFSWVEKLPKKHYNITFENIPANNSQGLNLNISLFSVF